MGGVVDDIVNDRSILVAMQQDEVAGCTTRVVKKCFMQRGLAVVVIVIVIVTGTYRQHCDRQHCAR